MSESLHGVWVAMPTPWTAAGRIDAGAVRELVTRYRAAGLHGAYTTGTDGEMHAVELDDFAELAKAFGGVARETGLPAQMGCTWSHTEGVIARARLAAEAGVEIIQVALPGWIPLADDDIRRLFASISEAVPETRIVHYNIARTGRFFQAREYAMVAEVAPGLTGSKHTGGDTASLIEIVEDGPPLDHFVVDTQIVPGAMVGAKGFYSFMANLSPPMALALWEACAAEAWDEATAIRLRIDALFRRWRGVRPSTLASPALGKIATRAGVFPELSLAVRPPYGTGTGDDVTSLQELVRELTPEWAMGS